MTATSDEPTQVGSEPGGPTEPAVSTPIEFLRAGQHVGRYVIESRLGVGGMGVVYVAVDSELDRRVALKVVRTRASEASTRRAHRRLQREAMAMAALSHPNVVAIHDVGIHAGRLFIAMELVEGESLRQWLATPRSTNDIVRMFVAAGRGLAAAHAAGVVHRDFKPDNVLVGDGRVVVLDFGLARLEITPTQPVRESDDKSLGPSGTPAYMAPEQFARATVGPAGDQFSFCIALHEALTGMRPFVGSNPLELARAVTRGERRPVPRGAMPARLQRIIDRGLYIDSAERWPSMNALIAALERTIARPRRWIWVLCATAVIGLGALLWPRPRSGCRDSEARIGAIWNETIAFDRALAYAGKGDAARESWARARGHLDTWASEWVDVHRELCAARVDDEDGFERDVGMVCLRERAAAFEETLAAIAPDDVDASQAFTLVSALPNPGGCRALSDPTAQVDPELAAAREARSRMEVLILAARYADAIALARDTMAASSLPIDDPAILALRSDLGRAQSYSFDYAAARSELEQVYWAAMNAGHDDAAAKASCELLSVLSNIAVHDVDMWIDAARTSAERSGNLRHKACFLGGLGNVRLKQGRPADAAAAWEEQVAILVDFDANHLATFAARQNHAAALASIGHEMESVAIYEDLIPAMGAAVGESHPELIPPLVNLAVNLPVDRAEESVAAGRRAVAIAVDSHGEEALRTLEIRRAVASVLSKRGRHAESLEELRDMLRISLAHHADNAAWLDRLHIVIARELAALGRDTEARMELEHAWPSLRRGDDDLGAWVAAVGEAQLEARRPEAARVTFERLALECGGANSHRTVIGLAQAGLAEVALFEGDARTAVMQFELALPRLDISPNPWVRGELRLSFAKALWETGDKTRAHALVDEARALSSLPTTLITALDAWKTEHADPTSPALVPP